TPNRLLALTVRQLVDGGRGFAQRDQNLAAPVVLVADPPGHRIEVTRRVTDKRLRDPGGGSDDPIDPFVCQFLSQRTAASQKHGDELRPDLLINAPGLLAAR